jgi:CubicO group peptidase (beta-lactamase class C family)
MAAPIRSKFIYNNLMYTVAAYLIEQLTGCSFAAFLQARLFYPLGMTSTYLQPSVPIAEGRTADIASGHYFDEDTGDFTAFAASEAREGVGAGSIITSIEDHIKWVQALLLRRGPITKEVYAALTTPRTIMDDDIADLYPYCSPSLYALGLETHWYRGHQIVVHEGSVSGFGSIQLFVPSVDFGLCILGNASVMEDLGDILARELVDAALQVLLAERPDWVDVVGAKFAKMD